MKRKNCTALFLMLTTLCGTLSGCGSKDDTAEVPAACPYKDFITVDVFDNLANFQGIQSGWFAKIVKDKFNMELNIIAPNVSGGGDTLYEMRSAAGNLGDLIISSGESGKLQELVDSGLVLNMQPYLEDQDIMTYSYAIDLLNDKITQDGIYGIPCEISLLSADTSSEGLEPTFGPYIRWDLYEQLGYPEMNTLEDMLPVLKSMQKLYPETESGNKTYAFSFFKAWDGNLMNAVKQPCCFYGYDEAGFVLAKADGSDYQDITDENSLYMRVLKFYFEANQLGLVDPGSSTQTYDDLYVKYQDGAILYCPWPWLAQSAYNTLDHMQRGTGYMLATISDMEIFSYGCNPEGNQKSVISIGSGAEDPARLADFINWLYSPEGITINSAQPSDGSAGPQGLTWDYDENGPYLTEFGQAALLNGDVAVPEEWGGGSWKDGVSALNFKPVSINDISPWGFSYNYTLWDSVISMETTTLDQNWQKYTGANSSMSYLANHDMLIVAPGCSYVAAEESSEITTIRSQCRSVITEYSWKMIFAETEEVYDRYQDELQEKLKALNYDEVLEVDLAGAIAQHEARDATVKNN